MVCVFCVSGFVVVLAFEFVLISVISVVLVVYCSLSLCFNDDCLIDLGECGLCGFGICSRWGVDYCCFCLPFAGL